MLKWLSDNQKYIAMIIFIVLVCFLAWNLWVMIKHFDSSLMYTLSQDKNVSNADMTEQWAMRGQMGDILSGHFSALAFLAVALSIFLQNEANKQMRESIKQQDNIIQIQTEEFFIANMNVKLDRYYKMLDNQIERVVNKNSVANYISNQKIMNNNKNYDYSVTTLFNEACNEIETVILILNPIHKEITNIQNLYPQAYQGFMDELKVKVLSTQALHNISTHYKDKDKCETFAFFEL